MDTDQGSLIWVPTKRLADALAGVRGIDIGYGPLDPRDGGQLVGEALRRVEFYVPPSSSQGSALGALRHMPHLRIVQALSAGVDHLLPHLPANVTLCNVRGVANESVAEWCVLVILAALRRLRELLDAQAVAHWAARPTSSLSESKILIVGYGSIGATLGARLLAFGASVCKVARAARDGVAGAGDVGGLLPEADVVVLLLPSTPETAGMVDATFLRRMKDGALLVNAARGNLVVTDALLAELMKGRILAALDATDPEPLPPEHPLWRAPNVIITPHIAGWTFTTARNTVAFVREQVERYAKGAPLVNTVRTGS